MELSVIDCILIALIVAIVVHLLFGTFSNKEHLSNEPVKMEEHTLPEESLFDRVSSESRSDLVSNVSAFTCPIANNEQDVEQYMRDIVGGKQFKCDNIDKVDGKEYVDNFWNFNENVNKDTSAGVDVVDKINELYVTNNNELTGNRGMKISDLFNSLTANAKSEERLASGNFVCAKSMPCLPNDVIDQVSQSGDLSYVSQPNSNVDSWYDSIVGNSKSDSYASL